MSIIYISNPRLFPVRAGTRTVASFSALLMSTSVVNTYPRARSLAPILLILAPLNTRLSQPTSSEFRLGRPI